MGVIYFLKGHKELKTVWERPQYQVHDKGREKLKFVFFAVFLFFVFFAYYHLLISPPPFLYLFSISHFLYLWQGYNTRCLNFKDNLRNKNGSSCSPLLPFWIHSLWLQNLRNFPGRSKQFTKTVILAPCENEPLSLDLFFTEICYFSNIYFIVGILLISSKRTNKMISKPSWLFLLRVCWHDFL